MKIIITCLFQLFSHLTFAQNNSIIHVKYKFTHVRDLNVPNEPFEGEYLLSIKNNESRFLPYFLYEDVNNKKTQTQVPSSASASTVVTGMPVLVVSNSGAMLVEETKKVLGKGTVQTDARILSKYFYYSDVAPKIVWTIEDDFRKILNYNCQKATGSFMGRQYIAWFTNDIPVSDGPWKFSGLPGLILEITDSKNEVSYKATEIFRNADSDVNSVIHNDNSIKLSKKEYVELKIRFEENPEDVAQGFYPNGKVGIRNIQNPDNKTVKKIAKYNLVEK